jgi:PelA/Pel-15E family pectate lyase
MKLSRVLVLYTLVLLPAITIAQKKDLAADARRTMLKATQYMVEKVSTNGGYLWNYTEDFSRRWGELEAYKTQIWIQDPGTPAMGTIFLDAYHATGDEYYYQSAEKVAQALIWGQHPSGGWNYFVDFAGDRSMKEWYRTIGKNAWGFEEFYHYYGNATFDDQTTKKAAEFLLRIYLEKLDPRFRPALDKAIEFVLKSQYPLGGWPQRYPLKYDYSHDGLPDYTSFYTFSGTEIIWGNIEFLIHCYTGLGEERFLDPIRRGMNFFLITQQGNPQAGWGYQYSMDLKPASARSFEPAALSPSQTYNQVLMLMRFYQYTGDRKFLARIPDAIQWLESARLPDSMNEGGTRTHSLSIEVGTNRPLFPHRKGHGVTDGHYWIDHSDKDIITHLGQKHTLDIDALKREYERVNALTPEEATKNSPLKPAKHHVDEQEDPSANEVPDESKVRAVINALDGKNRWLVKHVRTSKPYGVSDTGEETNTAMSSDIKTGEGTVDPSDQLYISIREYLKNMHLLINFVRQRKN